MPRQDEHDRPENLAEPADLSVKPAESLEDAANSNNSLEGYAAINDLNETEFGKEAVALEEEKRKAVKKGGS